MDGSAYCQEWIIEPQQDVTPHKPLLGELPKDPRYYHPDGTYKS